MLSRDHEAQKGRRFDGGASGTQSSTPFSRFHRNSRELSATSSVKGALVFITDESDAREPFSSEDWVRNALDETGRSQHGHHGAADGSLAVPCACLRDTGSVPGRLGPGAARPWALPGRKTRPRPRRAASCCQENACCSSPAAPAPRPRRALAFGLDRLPPSCSCSSANSQFCFSLAPAQLCPRLPSVGAH